MGLYLAKRKKHISDSSLRASEAVACPGFGPGGRGGGSEGGV